MTRTQRGATTVELALVLLVFLMFLLGILDMSRLLFTWNAAGEATRYGARFAVVCDDTGNEAQVLARMRAVLPQITDVDVNWVPAGCSHADCQGVTVEISALDYQWISPLPGIGALPAFRMPRFSTFLPREVMRQDPHSAAMCSS